MLSIYPRLLIPVVMLGVIVSLSAFGAEITSPQDVVKEAAQAFIKGYNSHDLSQFDTFFALPEQGGDTQGLIKTQGAAHKMLKELQPTSIKMLEFYVNWPEVDAQNKLATGHYRAEISIVLRGETIYAVEQNVSLVRVHNRWLIAGGDTPQITPLESFTP